MGFCYNFNLIYNYTKLTSVDFGNSRNMQWEKKGPRGPGTFKKVLGLMDLFSLGIMERSLGSVLSRPGTFPGLTGMEV